MVARLGLLHLSRQACSLTELCKIPIKRGLTSFQAGSNQLAA
jgi:hypothetical protein